MSPRRNLSNRTNSVSVKSIKVKGYKSMVIMVQKKYKIPAIFLLSHLKRKSGIFFKLYFKLANPLVHLRLTMKTSVSSCSYPEVISTINF